MPTAAAGGQHHALVEYSLSKEDEVGALRCAGFLMEYYSEGDPYVVVDICLRMLTPRELANATSFPPQYVINRGHDGRMFTKSQQVHMIGNAVPPDLQYAVTAANYTEQPEPELMLEAA